MQGGNEEDLRAELAERRKAKTNAIARLKAAAKKATNGNSTPITDSYNVKRFKPDESSDDLTPTARLERTKEKVRASREARKNGLDILKQTTMAAFRLDAEPGNA